MRAHLHFDINGFLDPTRPPNHKTSGIWYTEDLLVGLTFTVGANWLFKLQQQFPADHAFLFVFGVGREWTRNVPQTQFSLFEASLPSGGPSQLCEKKSATAEAGGFGAGYTKIKRITTLSTVKRVIVAQI